MAARQEAYRLFYDLPSIHRRKLYKRLMEKPDDEFPFKDPLGTRLGDSFYVLFNEYSNKGDLRHMIDSIMVEKNYSMAQADKMYQVIIDEIPKVIKEYIASLYSNAAKGIHHSGFLDPATPQELAIIAEAKARLAARDYGGGGAAGGGGGGGAGHAGGRRNACRRKTSRRRKSARSRKTSRRRK